MLTKEYLIYKYVLELVPRSEIVKQTGFWDGIVKRSLLKFGIPLKDNHRAHLDRLFTKEFLTVLYVNKRIAIFKIAKMFNSDAEMVRQYLNKFGIIIDKSRTAKGRSKHSKESKEKIGKANSNKKSLEHRRKMSEAHKGDKHYNWKGGISPLRNLIRESFEGKIWTNNVYKRDNYTCKKCGKKGVEAHHIKPFCVLLKEFLQIYSQFSPVEDKETLLRLAVNHQPFWDISNGVSLCLGCHNLVEDGVIKL